MIKKGYSILFLLITIISLIILTLPGAMAKEKEKKDIVIKSNKNYEISVKADEGELKYSWIITEPTIGNISLRFYITDEGENIKINITNENSSAGEIKVKTKIYYLIWENNNNFPITLNYRIEYPPRTGCYSSTMMLSILLFVMVFWLAGSVVKKR